MRDCYRMLYDGLGYFIVLTSEFPTYKYAILVSTLAGVNLFNLVLYRTTDELYQVSFFPLRRSAGLCVFSSSRQGMSEKECYHSCF